MHYYKYIAIFLKSQELTEMNSSIYFHIRKYKIKTEFLLDVRIHKIGKTVKKIREMSKMLISGQT